ncbi:hypothetical protein Sulfitobl28_32910 (plasmid) [Sulfitobacter pontiacus]|nr:hypothetical protein Sulfitobl28_32910 [Sulfitobacter pontiacus]
MNGGADLGGMMGFGPVVQEEDEPLFHAPGRPARLVSWWRLGPVGSGISMLRDPRARICIRAIIPARPITRSG